MSRWVLSPKKKIKEVLVFRGDLDQGNQEGGALVNVGESRVGNAPKKNATRHKSVLVASHVPVSE